MVPVSGAIIETRLHIFDRCQCFHANSLIQVSVATYLTFMLQPLRQFRITWSWFTNRDSSQRILWAPTLVAARTLINILLDPSTLIYLKLWSDQSKHQDCQSIHFSSTNSVSASIGCIYFFSSPTTLHSVPPLALWSDQLFIQLLKQNFKLQGKSAAATTKSNSYFNRRSLNTTDEGRRCRDTILVKRRQSRKEKKSCQNIKGSNDA
jgi:hypothetical protein